MQKKYSKTNINGKIIMMQNDLMSKLATIQHPTKTLTDQLGFPTKSNEFDSLTNLLSKAKQVTSQNKDKILVAKKSSVKNVSKKQSQPKKKSQTGTFLTGIGLAVEPQQKPQVEDDKTKIIHRDYYSNPMYFQQEDPDEMIKEMIKKNQGDDLAELRRMIKQTDSSLQDYGKQLLKTRKSVLDMADKFCDIDYNVVDKIYRYEDKGYL